MAAIKSALRKILLIFFPAKKANKENKIHIHVLCDANYVIRMGIICAHALDQGKITIKCIWIGEISERVY